MKLRAFLSTLVCFMIVNSVYTQNSFHRIYPFTEPEPQSLCGDAIQLKNGQYMSVDFLLDINGQDNTSDTLIVNLFQAKGDVATTKKIYIDSTKYGRLLINSKPSITQAKDGRIFIIFETSNGPKSSKHILRFTNGQNEVITSLSTTKDNNDGISGFGTLLPSYANNLYAIYGAGNDTIDNTEICINKRPLIPTQSGFTKMLRATDSNGDDISSVATDVSVNDKFNRIALTGILDSVNNEPLLLVVDSTAKVILSKKYLDAQNPNSILIPTGIAITRDTGYVVAGYSASLVFPIGFLFKGFVLKTDKKGDVTWGKIVSFADETWDLTRSLTIDNANNIVIGYMSIDLTNGISTPFAVQLDQNGKEKAKKQFPRVPINGDLQGNMFRTPDGGTAWFSTGIDSSKAVLSFLKLDDKLKSTCEQVIDQEILFDNEFVADTVIWKSRIDTVITQIDSVKSFINAYDVPELALEVRPFCPNEPINWLFQATTGGSTNYKWSTGVEGPQHDTLRVFEEGKYSVTVTVDKDVCFMLCDTVELTRYKVPTVSANVTLGNFCANNKLTITAQYNPGHPTVRSYKWSTGESTKSIEVSAAGEYSVTIVDECGETASALVNTGSFPVKITAATITPQIDINCIKGTMSGQLIAGGNSSENLLGVERFKWSPSGTTSKVLLINQETPIMVTVTVSDGCGGTATASYSQEFTGPGIKGTDVSISADISTFCANNTLRLNAFVNEISNKATYKWSNGATTAFTEVLQPGTYTVTVTDICGNTASATKVTGDFPKKITNVTISSDLKDLNCESIVGTVSAKGNSTVDGSYGLGVERYLWSSSTETTNTISIDQNFKVSITVTVTDGCGNTATSNFTRDVIGPNNFENISDLSYARVFFPEGVHVFGDRDTSSAFRDTVSNHQLNRSFGPIKQNDNSCFERITDYEFYVFNRWGQQVFESKDIDDEWNGLKDDVRWPSDTYVWVVRYKIFGIEKKLKGDVTLIR